jgi:hypothetical protein
MRRSVKAATWALAAQVAMTLAASPAGAQSRDSIPAPPTPTAPPHVGDDVVYLKDGGLMRGTLIDVLPGAQARIQLVTGEVHTLPWEEIDHIDRGANPSLPVAGPPAAASQVLLHVEAPVGVVVQQDVTNSDNWQTVCTAPCDKLLSTAFAYRVSGAGIRASSDFTLGPPGSSERLVIDPASKGAYVLGVLGMGVGAVLAYVGLIVAALSTGDDDGGNGSGGSASGGLIMMGVGAVAAVGGLVLALTNGKTRVTTYPGLGANAGSLRPPLWTKPQWSIATAAGAEQKMLPSPVGIPLFSGRF